jgi:hypothetical protein
MVFKVNPSVCQLLLVDRGIRARILLAVAAAAIIASPLAAEERGQQRYIVVIRQH